MENWELLSSILLPAYMVTAVLSGYISGKMQLSGINGIELAGHSMLYIVPTAMTGAIYILAPEGVLPLSIIKKIVLWAMGFWMMHIGLIPSGALGDLDWRK